MRRFKTAQALDGDRSRVREALAAGDLLLDQAGVVVRAVEALTTGVAKDLVDAETVATAEEKLLELAKVHDAKALTVLGRRILDVVAPEVGEAHEARVLDAEERLAEEDVRLTVREDERGRLQGRFTIPSLSGAMFKKHLMALASPAGKKIEGDRSESFSPKRMGQAFVAYIERYPTAKLPTSGGLAATMAITVSHDTLVSALGAARLDTGQPISPALARMTACVDVGRKKRFHTRAMRIALTVQQGGCTEENCDHPPGLSHVHHDDVSWGEGGGTSAAKGRLLCPHHHRRAHDPTYAMTKLPNDKVRFTRRT